MSTRALPPVAAACSWLGLAALGLIACGSDRGQPASSTGGTGAQPNGGGGGVSAVSGSAGVTSGGSAGASGNAGTGGGGAGTAGGGVSGAGGSAGNSAGNGGASGGGGSSGNTCAIPAAGMDPPAQLSATGCVKATDATQADAAFLPYDVNSPLWSDGASKERYLRMPTGGTISVKDCDLDPASCGSTDTGGSAEDEGHWDLPVGTVLMKYFSVAGKRVETRLLMHTADTTWRGFSYEWNDAGTDATLLPDGKDKDLGTQVWHYPTRSECLQCHTAGAGRSLGPTTRQLDRDFNYPDGKMNQIDKFVALGFLTAKPKALGAYPPPDGAAALDLRARSYLQANCSICHRPGGPISDVDLRYVTSFKDTALCNQPIERGTGDPLLPQVRFVPGMPAQSSLSFRMHDRTTYKMPKIGSNIMDPSGTKLIDDWITATTTCPN